MNNNKDINKTNNLTAEQVTELTKTFALIDLDQDGMVTTKELGRVMRSLGQNPTEAELTDMLRKIDTDGNGLIDFDEFLHMMSNALPDQDRNEAEAIKETFRVFDKDGDGYITASELAEVMYRLGEDVSPKDVREIIKQVGTKAGRISFKEFCNVMSCQD